MSHPRSGPAARYRPTWAGPVMVAIMSTSACQPSAPTFVCRNDIHWNRKTSAGTLSDNDRRNSGRSDRPADAATARNIPAPATKAPATKAHVTMSSCPLPDNHRAASATRRVNAPATATANPNDRRSARRSAARLSMCAAMKIPVRPYASMAGQWGSSMPTTPAESKREHRQQAVGEQPHAQGGGEREPERTGRFFRPSFGHAPGDVGCNRLMPLQGHEAVEEQRHRDEYGQNAETLRPKNPGGERHLPQAAQNLDRRYRAHPERLTRHATVGSGEQPIKQEFQATGTQRHGRR